MLNHEHKSSTGCLKKISAVIGICIFLSAQLSVNAGSLNITYGNVFSGTTPAGSAPWLTAVFTDDSSGTVQLTLSGAGLSDSDYVSGWYFNVIDGVNPSDLTFTPESQTGTFTSSASAALNNFKADGSGKYDIMFGFSNGVFTGGDSITYTIGGVAGLDASDFDAVCCKSAGIGPFLSAADIKFSDQSDNWVYGVDPPSSVPDNSETILLLGIGILALEGARKKLRLFQSLKS